MFFVRSQVSTGLVSWVNRYGSLNSFASVTTRSGLGLGFGFAPADDATRTENESPATTANPRTRDPRLPRRPLQLVRSPLMQPPSPTGPKSRPRRRKVKRPA